MPWTKRIDFTLWPVGQGLFTTVDTWVGGKYFRVVYDCGTSSRNPLVTDQAFAAMQGRAIDLLVVSHFHYDHISGIPQLLKCVGQVKEVWLPYLSPDQRLLYALSCVINGVLTGANEADLVDLTDLVASGPDWFKSRGCIVEEVGGAQSKNPKTGSSDKTPPSDEARSARSTDESEHMESSGPRELYLGKLQRSDKWFSTRPVTVVYHVNLEAVGQNGNEKQAVVEFLTWVRPITENKTQGLKTRLEQWLKDVDPSLELKNLRSTNGSSIKAIKALVRAIGEKVSRKQLSGIYRKTNSGLNEGSLFLLEHPIQEDAEYNLSLYTRCPWLRLGRVKPMSGPAVLWTGDAPKAILERLVKDPKNKIREPLEAVLIHQVPHHGSIKSLSDIWVKTIGNQWKPCYGPMSIISAGRTNTYGHPHPQVVSKYSAHVVTEGSSAFECSFEWR